MEARELLGWAAIVVAVALGFFVGMAWYAHSHQEKWLYDYQALIAGILAVIAAAITVAQMRRDDVAQDLRHRELVSLSLRADRLKVRRAATLAPRLRKASRIIEKLRVDLAAVGQCAYSEFYAVHGRLYKLGQPLDALLHERSLEDAEDLFDAKLAATLEHCRHYVDAWDNHAKYLQSVLIGPHIEGEVALSKLAALGRSLGSIGLQLDQLVATYERSRSGPIE